MTVPTAVSPSVVTPGVYTTVNLLSGSSAAGIIALRALLLAPKTGSGDLTVDTEIREGSGEDSAATAFGTAGVGHLAAKLLYQEAPQVPIDFGAPTAGAGAASRNITATGSPASNNAVEFNIDGRVVEVAWNALETADTFKTRAIADLQAAELGELPLLASDGGVGITTLTARDTGNVGNDHRVRARLVYAQTGTEAIDTNTFTNLAGGTTDPDFTSILSAAANTEYHFIVMCLSNADAQSNSATSNPARCETHINTYNTGLDSKLQQCVVASTGSIANAKTGAIARNEGTFEHVCCVNGLGLPCELAAREAGGRLAVIPTRPSTNRIGEQLDGYYGSVDVTGDQPTTAELEDALTNGVALVKYNSSGNPVISRPITTYSADSGGGADRRLLDVTNVDVAYVVVRDVRKAVATEFEQVSVVDDIQAGDDELPEGVVELRDIKSFVVERLRDWARNGNIQRAPLEAAIKDGSVIVRINPSDHTQVDFVLPFKAVQPLAKFGIVGQRQPG